MDYPIQETEHKKKYRENGGLTNIMTVDASLFKNAFEHDNRESLPWNQRRLENLRDVVSSGNSIDAYPEVGIGHLGKLGVNDGRHRISHAAELGKNIDIAVTPKDEILIRDRLKKQEYLDRAKKMLNK